MKCRVLEVIAINVCKVPRMKLNAAAPDVLRRPVYTSVSPSRLGADGRVHVTKKFAEKPDEPYIEQVKPCFGAGPFVITRMDRLRLRARIRLSAEAH